MAANILTLLKPGGSLQWDECNYSATGILRSQPDSTVGWLHRTEMDFINRYRSRLDYGWSTLPGIFEELGLQDLRTDVVSSDRVPETRTGMTRVLSMGIFEWLRAMASESQDAVWLGEDIPDLQANTNKDIESGAYARFDIHIAMGSKPRHRVGR